MMKKIYILAFLAGISIYSKAQNGTVGINKTTPDAALDIKSDDADKVLRFSTIPTDIDGDAFDFFVGKKDGDAYDLRRLNVNNFIDRIPSVNLLNIIKEEIPMLKRIVVRSSLEKDFANNPDDIVEIDEEILNTDKDSFRFYLNDNGIYFLQPGTYEISSWVGFEELSGWIEGDMVVSIEKGIIGQNNYSNIYSTIISRTDISTTYNVGNGVGVAFTFVADFKKAEAIRLRINTLDFNNHPQNPNLNLFPDATISVTKLTKD